MATTKRKKQEELQPRLLKMRDAAKYLAMSPGKLRTIIQNGELKVIRVGDKTAPWLVDLVEINAWIDRTKEQL